MLPAMNDWLQRQHKTQRNGQTEAESILPGEKGVWQWDVSHEFGHILGPERLVALNEMGVQVCAHATKVDEGVANEHHDTRKTLDPSIAQSIGGSG